MTLSTSGHAIRWGRRKTGHKDVFYTPRELAGICVSQIPSDPGDSFLDPCAGRDAFYSAFPPGSPRERLEIAEGSDFFDYEGSVDWVVSNPPYSILDEWLAKSCSVANKGFGYLIGWNNLTARRIEACERAGFGISSVSMFKVFQWYGMSAWVIWERGAPGVIGYNRKVWRESDEAV